MNYCYVYYVGNYVDVFKYLVLVWIFVLLGCKDMLYVYLDSYFGVGFYDL